MPNKMILKKSTIILLMMFFSVLSWGAQKKTSAPPPAKTTVTAKPAQPVNRGGQGGGGTAGHGGGVAGRSGGHGGGGGAGGNGGHGGGTAGIVSHLTHGGGRVDIGSNSLPLAYHGSDGKEAKFGAKGQVSEIRDPKRNMTIRHGLRAGDTRIVTEKPNGTRLVSTGPHAGYAERHYIDRNGHTYYQRTYWDRGHADARVYRDQFYRGVRYPHYVPAHYYHPAFYGWAYHPWGRVYFSPAAWGWVGSPWYGFYSGYFAPYPVYPTASLWLTDYLLAENLRLAYSNGPGAGVAVPANQPWTDTGVELHEGDEVNISARGVISYRPGNNVSPAGAPPDCSVAGPQSAPFPAPQLPCWSLVGRIGQNGEIFEVGPHARFHSNASGELYLGVNDNILGDNSGSWTASIRASQTDQPVVTPMSPEAKEMIDAEVQRQLQAEQSTAQSSQPPLPTATAEALPAALDPKQRLFVVSSNLDVATADRQECELTPGDVVTRIDDNPTDNRVRVSVMSSKQNDCGVRAMPLVAVDDLQEMHNSFHAQLDSGLQTLAAQAGTKGLPKAPDTQTQAGEVPPPVPDAHVEAQLADQQKEAAQSDAEVLQEVSLANH